MYVTIFGQHKQNSEALDNTIKAEIAHKFNLYICFSVLGRPLHVNKSLNLF